MVRTLSIVFFLVLAYGCTPSGRVVDSSGVEYSEYFQCLIYSEDNTISFDAFITLGKERLPNTYSLSPSQEKYLSSPDAILSVNEVYIRNHSEAPVQLSKLIIGEGVGSFSRKYQPQIIEVASAAVVLSRPIVDVTSIYGPSELPCSISYEMQGESYELSGKWKRLTIGELKR
ncbi:hypothetical protein ACJJI4_18740 [Microbulbifer sp. TRSA002]|uniref:hypothetical protein n=1 Tax=Microbulbifer sp. TRSA002 TaxID=3243382 RepID=UPI0040398E80